MPLFYAAFSSFGMLMGQWFQMLGSKGLSMLYPVGQVSETSPSSPLRAGFPSHGRLRHWGFSMLSHGSALVLGQARQSLGPRFEKQSLLALFFVFRVELISKVHGVKIPDNNGKGAVEIIFLAYPDEVCSHD